MANEKLRYKTLIDFSRILTFFENEGIEEIGVGDIAKSLGMLPSKVSRMLKTLEAEGFFEKDSVSGKYRLGARYLQPGMLYALNHPLRRMILPHLEQISQDLKVLTSWGFLKNAKVFIVDRITISISPPVHLFGTNVPMHSSSYGKLFLAYLEGEEQERILNSLDYHPLTTATVTNKKALIGQLKRIRKQGYAEDDEETRAGIHGMAVPVFNARADLVAAIAISPEKGKLRENDHSKLITYLTGKSLFISRQLGYQPSAMS